MNCEQANQMDMVDYLISLGFSPAKSAGENYFFLSPLRHEETASFKVNRTKNIWYDHGEGKGGTLVDFVCHYCSCGLKEALQRIEENPGHKISPDHPQKHSGLFQEPEVNSIKVLSSLSPITDMVLNRYLKQRSIPRQIAYEYCKQVHYKNGDKYHWAIGFKNNSGGYELRSPNFKGSSSPKYVTYYDNGANSIKVFEGFFDFLSYQSIHPNPQNKASNMLVLNSLSFFTRSLLLMEKHEKIHLYLDNDKAGKQCVEEAIKRTNKVVDESHVYRGYKDLNEWLVNSELTQRQQHSRGLRR
jgi:hypothetical protein